MKKFFYVEWREKCGDNVTVGAYVEADNQFVAVRIAREEYPASTLGVVAFSVTEE